jgi:hypothetical protein
MSKSAKSEKKSTKGPKKQKFNTTICDNKMTFDDCELAILRHAIDETEEIQQKKIANNDEIVRILETVEKFIAKRKLVCYGGTAINNILPKHAQFYNRDIEIPDYDFYSSNAMDDAMDLANIYHKEGYAEVEAKAGVHAGTFKVYVNFIPIADITQLNKRIFKQISKDAIKVAGILYSPPNFLRMNMFLELSRPAGDVSRWEKVLKRMNLLNEYYPMDPGADCNNIDFQRKMDADLEDGDRLYIIVRDTFINQDVIFFGGYASSLYSKYMGEHERKMIEKIPDFDVLSEEPEKCATIVKEKLQENGFKQVSITHHEEIGELIPDHYEIRVGKETVAFVYSPIACHSYNNLQIDGKTVHVASIDTILTFYLAFTYIDEPYYNKDRLLCMANFLFDVEQKNRLEQKGLLKRFSIDCYGKQLTMEEIRSQKATRFKALSSKRGTREFDYYFLKYNPAAKKRTVKDSKTMDKKKKTQKSRTLFKLFM